MSSLVPCICMISTQKKDHAVEITIHGDLAELTPHLANIPADQVQISKYLLPVSVW